MPGIRRTPWGTNIPIERRVAAERETNGFQRHFESEIERRRVDPQDDLLTNLLNATLDEPGVDPRVSSEWSRSRCDSPVRRKACSASPPAISSWPA